MRKLLLKTLLAVGIVSLLSSCLGDTKNSTTFPSGYGYLKYTEKNVLCAATSAGLVITSDVLYGLDPGRVYKMGAEIDYSNQYDQLGQHVVFMTDKLDIQNGGLPLPKADAMMSTSEVSVENEIPMSALKVVFYGAERIYTDDVWVFGFTCKVYENEDKNNIKFEAYLDTDEQFLLQEDGTKKDLAGNQAIVKVFAKREVPVAAKPGESKKDYYKEMSISMSDLRRHFESRPAEDGDEAGFCYVVFEFSGEDKDGNAKEKPERIGSFNEALAQYGMIRDKE